MKFFRQATAVGLSVGIITISAIYAQAAHSAGAGGHQVYFTNKTTSTVIVQFQLSSPRATWTSNILRKIPAATSQHLVSLAANALGDADIITPMIQISNKKTNCTAMSGLAGNYYYTIEDNKGNPICK